MNGKKIWLLVCCLLFSSMAPAAWAVVDPPANAYVADYADVLEKDTEDYIIELNHVLQQATGAQIVVVTVDFTDGMSLEEYAYTIFNEWGIGDEEKNNGLLLLLSIGDDDYWAMQGKGLENTLTSAVLGEYLYQNLEPDFAQGRYNAGVKKVFDSFYAWFVNYYGVHAQDSAGISVDKTESQWSMPTLAWFLIFVLILSIFIALRQNYLQRRSRAHRRSMMAPPVYPPYRPLSPGARVRWPSQSAAPAPKEKPKKHTGGGFFGGGTSRGGGAGRQSTRGNRSSSIGGGRTGTSKMKGGIFGGGASRGGGAGRQSAGSFRPQSRSPVAGAKKAGSFGGGKTRGGGAGRRP